MIPLEGDLVSDIIDLKNGSLTITGAELSTLLERAALKGYLLAEQKRQAFLTTPDGNIDKTITGYKPLPYQEALSQSSSLLSVPGTGKEEWKGDPPSDLSPELLQQIADIYFSVFPRPLLLSERISE
jgi:hypothetical protein